MVMRSEVTVSADILDRLNEAMPRGLDDDDAGLETVIRNVMHAAYGTPHRRHDTDIAEASLAEVRERSAGATGASTGRPGRRINHADEVLAVARMVEAIGTAAHVDTLAVNGLGCLPRRVADDLADLGGGAA